MRPVYWKSICGWQWQMVTVNISSALLVNLQPLMSYRVAMLFLEMNTGSISSGGKISKLCLSS